ncbi:hypothetical protein GOP47_0011121, partial [Adiantum capillus-veneris]
MTRTKSRSLMQLGEVYRGGALVCESYQCFVLSHVAGASVDITSLGMRQVMLDR